MIDRPLDESPEELINRTVLDRATHRSRDSVAKTLSDWSVADLVTGEYRGRFLIELIQNARDALLERSPGTRDGTLLVRLTQEPALVVANVGTDLSADTVLTAIGRFGLGNKVEGESIGHKGIGFKSVLEISLTPEIYSCRRGSDFELAVRFDPIDAAEMIRASSEGWDETVRDLLKAEDASGAFHIPTLLFPQWVGDPRARIGDAATAQGVEFDTIIRLPYDERFDRELGIDRAVFIEKVRKAIRGLSDQMVLLLEAFGTIVVEDQIANTRETIRRAEHGAGSAGHDTWADVAITRNWEETSRWRLFKRVIPDLKHLEASVAVGVRLTARDDHTLAVGSPIVRPGDAGGAFHLFFPTEIPTRLPFLLHAYFRVDAGRRSFAPGRQERNQPLLEGLRGLAVDAVGSLLARAAGGIDLTPLAGLLAGAADGSSGDSGPESEDDRRQLDEFRTRLLADLDRLPWAPATSSHGTGSTLVRPGQLLIELDESLQGDLPMALPPRHLAAATSLLYPARGLSQPALRLLAARASVARGGEPAGLTRDLLRALLRPSDGRIWADSTSEIDDGFRALLRVLAVLRARRDSPAAVLDDPALAADLRFIPVVDSGPTRRQLRPPTFGAPWILARPKAAEDQPVPPSGLAIDFIPDGLLGDEVLIRSLAYLGIRDYQVDEVLDAITDEVVEAADLTLTSFVWRFLARDTQSAHSPRVAAGQMSPFVPGRWFWSEAGLRDAKSRQQMTRNRDLGRLPLRGADGGLHPAGKVAFGADWADWIASRRWPDAEDRAAAYRDLQAAAPSPSQLLASPSLVLADLGLPPAGEHDDDDDVGLDRLAHAFLVRIGVWEVPPVRSWNDLRQRSADNLDPWASWPGRAEHMAFAASQAKTLEGRGHDRVHVGEDFALEWPLSDTPEFLAALSRGVRFYERCGRQHAYCPRCALAREHPKGASAGDESDRPSMLRWQLEQTDWVPVSLHAEPARLHVRPFAAWRDGEAIDPSRLAQSAARFLQLVSPEVPGPLRNFLGIDQVETADAARLEGLLAWLHDNIDGLLRDERRPASDAGRAFLSLHRRIYERLAEIGNGAAIAATADTGVLCTQGGRLVFAERAAARHDKGNVTAYRGLFAQDVPVVVLRGEQTGVAKALGVDDFEVSFTRVSAGEGEPATDEVRGFLHDRIPYIMAVLVGYAVGGNTIDLGNRTFHARARRLASITVFRVRGMELLVRVKGTALERSHGKQPGDQIYVEEPLGTAPRVFHDFDGPDWEPRFRRAFAAYLASIVENDAYTMALRPLLEAKDEDEVVALMAEMGLLEQVDEVRRVIDAGDRLLRDDEERWWKALLPLLGVDLAVDPKDVEWPRRLQSAVEGSTRAAALGPEAVALLVRSGVTEGSRRDISSGGVLATLERADVDLRELDARLRAFKDRGLEVRAGARHLDDWRRAHEQEVVAVLTHAGDAEAEERPSAWALPSSGDWTTRALPADFLAPVLADLANSGLVADAEALASASASSALASLVGLTAPELWRWWADRHGQRDGDIGPARLAGWRRLLRAVVAAALTTPLSTRYEVRSAAARFEASLVNTKRLDDVLVALREHLAGHAELRDALVAFVRDFRGLALPSRDDVAAVAVEAGLGADRIDQVVTILAARAPEVADRVRNDVEMLEGQHVTAVEVVPPVAPGDEDRDRGDRVRVRTIKHRAVDTGRIGRAGERWAKAVVLRELLALGPAQRLAAVAAIEVAIRDRFEDAAVNQLLQAATDYREAADEDEAIEALSALVHASEVSDAFGFDLIGYLPDASGRHRVLLLEVKATSDRTFMVSRHEWKDVATHPRIRDAYAFMTVGRNEKGQPTGVEVLVNPAALREVGRIRLRVEDWRARYRGPAGRHDADERGEVDDPEESDDP